jgi:proline iminopeptidase
VRPASWKCSCVTAGGQCSGRSLEQGTSATLDTVGHPEGDWVCTPEAGRALAAGIPGARLVELADAGHFGFSESPAAFMEAVRVHLSRCRPGTDAPPAAPITERGS